MLINNIENNNIYEFNLKYKEFFFILALNNESFNEIQSWLTDFIKSFENWILVNVQDTNTNTPIFDYIP